MKQHPIPQDIASYEFRLVGDMTLKQFLQLAGGVVAGLFFYALPIHSFFRVPLIIFSVFMGILLAFFPVEERPLDIWITNFIKSIFHPTQLIWKKSAQVPPFLKTDFKKRSPRTPIHKVDQQKKDISGFLASLPEEKKELEASSQKIAEINKLLQAVKPSQVNIRKQKPTTTPQKSSQASLNVKVRKLGPQANQPQQNLVYKETDSAQQNKPIIKPAEPLSSPLKVENVAKKHRFQKKEEKKEELLVPRPPDVANILVGMTLTNKNAPLPNALIEVQDINGDIVRALKSNEKGQFYTATPLKNGIYKIIPEHSQYEFDIIKLELEGEILEPLKITALRKKEPAKNQKTEHVDLY